MLRLFIIILCLSLAITVVELTASPAVNLWLIVAGMWGFFALEFFVRRNPNTHPSDESFAEDMLELSMYIIRLHDEMQNDEWRTNPAQHQRVARANVRIDDIIKKARRYLKYQTENEQNDIFAELIYHISTYNRRVALALECNDPMIVHEDSLPELRLAKLTGIIGEYLYH